MTFGVGLLFLGGMLANASSLPLVQVPEACFQKVYPCALQAEEKVNFQLGQNEWTLSSGAQVLLLSPHEMQLVRGQAWGDLSEGTSLRFSALRFNGEGEALFSREKDRVLVRSLKGRIQVVGPSQYPEVPEGFENWYQGFDQHLHLQSGVPKAYDFSVFVRDWLSLQGREALLPTMKKRLEGYKSIQKIAIGRESEMYHKAFEIRRVAAEVAEQERLARAEQEEAEKKQLRQMYRRRYFQPDRATD